MNRGQKRETVKGKKAANMLIRIWTITLNASMSIKRRYFQSGYKNKT